MEAERDEHPWPARTGDPLHGRPPFDSCTRTYRLVDETTGAPVPPRVFQSARSIGCHARDLDGDRLRGHVLRQRWEKGR